MAQKRLMSELQTLQKEKWVYIDVDEQNVLKWKIGLRHSDLEGLSNQSQDQLSATLSRESTHSAASQNTAPALFSRSSTGQTLQETVDTGSIDQPIELEATNNEIKLPEMQERGGNGSLFGSRHASASSASGRRDAAAEAMDVDASFSRQLD
ncbi:hypothetical protein BN1723_008541 [Verticillium longisporum]|uniref:Uncharacterized protein n=1 Tax=Verticillium longisporum TaxID=100787 RepID=A0A0G4KGA4_VERLO|nr:hypothetical protein BN1723_008541 [Verticillium longisporum]